MQFALGSMYAIDDLLQLVTTERAEHLRLHAGSAPVFILRGEEHVVEGPEITIEDMELMFRQIGGSRRVRECRKQGVAEFVCLYGAGTAYLVQALFDGETIQLDFRRIAS